MTKLRFRPEVAADVREARRWYAERSESAAKGYVERLESVLERIAQNPTQFPVVHREIRRALVRRYPYAVFFVLEGETVVVLGVFHQAMRPRAWEGRG